MKRLVKHVVVVLAMVTSLGLVAPTLAYAREASKSTIAETPMQLYRVALQNYDHERTLINQTYHLACTLARKIELTRLREAKSAARKSIVRADYREAVVTATTRWQNALAVLGNPPLPPAQDHPVTTTTAASSLGL